MEPKTALNQAYPGWESSIFRSGYNSFAGREGLELLQANHREFPKRLYPDWRHEPWLNVSKSVITYDMFMITLDE